MSDNPYQPPKTDIRPPVPADIADLASRWQRLFGAVIDGLISTAIFLPLMMASGYLDRARTGTLGIGEILLWSIGGMVLFLALHGYLLATRGQTIGKLLVKTRIVSVADGRLLPFGRLLGLRYVPIWIVSAIPVVQMLGAVDALFVFRRDRRCVHDLIAGTRVIRSDAVARDAASADLQA